MRRRTTSMGADSSLELFLDTICNTFGGILFISLLVVIILNTSAEAIKSKAPDEAQQVALIESEIERQQLTDRLEQLRAAVAQQEAISRELFSEEVRRLAKSLREKQSRQTQLVVDKSEQIGETSQLQIEINQLAKSAEDRTAQIKIKTDELVTLEAQLQDAIAQRSKRAIIPKVSLTQLPAADYFLKGGKLHGPRLFPNGRINHADFNHLERGDQTHVEANPSGGVRVDPQGANRNHIAEKFLGIRPERFYVKLFCWPDSYGHFEAVRTSLESLQLKYELVPIPAQEPITIQPVTAPGQVQ